MFKNDFQFNAAEGLSKFNIIFINCLRGAGLKLLNLKKNSKNFSNMM